jgi:hypothetical protein
MSLNLLFFKLDLILNRLHSTIRIRNQTLQMIKSKTARAAIDYYPHSCRQSETVCFSQRKHIHPNQRVFFLPREIHLGGNLGSQLGIATGRNFVCIKALDLIK